jgi:hypothetical protein
MIAGVALAGSTAFLTWWTTTLSGLPDVGDPFDVAAFSRPIPDETNAFVLYREAVARLPKEPEVTVFDWKPAGPEHRAWLERSREALDLWREGTERPDALNVDPSRSNFDTQLNVPQSMRGLARAALLEGSRLEDQGDLEGALGWYRAMLRASRHLGRRGFAVERLIGIAIHRWSVDRLNRWAIDPRVDARLLRRALDAAIEANAATPPTSDMLKSEYLSLMHSMADPDLVVRLLDYEVVPDGKGGSTTVYGQNRWKSSLFRVRRRAMNEPERSRRVDRMIFANLLAYCDLPPENRPPKASSKITGTARNLGVLGDLYVVDASAPEAARALTPETLARWFATTIDAEQFMPAFAAVEKALARERSAQANLIVTLANNLHLRERGAYPEKVEDLVGPYLKELPAGYTPTK